MKCMNPEGLLVENMQKTQNFNITLTPQIKSDFKERLGKMVQYYHDSPSFKEIQPSADAEVLHETKTISASWFTQYKLIFKRGVLNALRNPMDIRSLYISVVILSLVVSVVFYGVIKFTR